MKENPGKVMVIKYDNVTLETTNKDFFRATFNWIAERMIHE